MAQDSTVNEVSSFCLKDMKLHISLKETAETEYWLHLLMLSEYTAEKEGNRFISLHQI